MPSRRAKVSCRDTERRDRLVGGRDEASSGVRPLAAPALSARTDHLSPRSVSSRLQPSGVREVLSGTVLSGENLRSASEDVLADLLRPIAQLGLPVLGVISDAQESIRGAVSKVFPNVPHQICQCHVLREAARPLFEIDRHLAVQVRKELGGVREVAEQVARVSADDPEREVVEDTILAVRQVTRTNGFSRLSSRACGCSMIFRHWEPPWIGAWKKGESTASSFAHPDHPSAGAWERAGSGITPSPHLALSDRAASGADIP